MKIYTYSQARQKLALLLKQAETCGSVLIKRRDGRTFSLTPIDESISPLNVPTINTRITTKEIVDIIRESRER